MKEKKNYTWSWIITHDYTMFTQPPWPNSYGNGRVWWFSDLCELWWSNSLHMSSEIGHLEVGGQSHRPKMWSVIFVVNETIFWLKISCVLWKNNILTENTDIWSFFEVLFWLPTSRWPISELRWSLLDHRSSHKLENYHTSWFSHELGHGGGVNMV